LIGPLKARPDPERLVSVTKAAVLLASSRPLNVNRPSRLFVIV
jgi:hypothetical protein